MDLLLLKLHIHKTAHKKKHVYILYLIITEYGLKSTFIPFHKWLMLVYIIFNFVLQQLYFFLQLLFGFLVYSNLYIVCVFLYCCIVKRLGCIKISSGEFDYFPKKVLFISHHVYHFFFILYIDLNFKRK